MGTAEGGGDGGGRLQSYSLVFESHNHRRSAPTGRIDRCGEFSADAACGAGEESASAPRVDLLPEK